MKESYAKHRSDVGLKFVEALSICHQVTYVKDEMIGDPLDV